MIIHKITEDQLVELQSKIIKDIDKRLDMCHEIIVGRKSVFEIGCKTKEEVTRKYEKLIKEREKISIPLEDFANLPVEDIKKFSI